jgi:hypothetical protein
MEQDKSVPIPPTAAYAPEFKKRELVPPPRPTITVAPVPLPAAGAGPNFEAMATFWFRLCISLLGFIASLFIILSKKFEDSVNKWGYSTIGMILGFWLK